jgi:hypothetical protein
MGRLSTDREHTDWAQKEKDEVAAAVRALSDCANRSHSAALFVEYMDREHRTLQQQMTGLFLAWMKHLASLEENHRYDLRNEDAVRLSKVCMKAIDEAGMIPHVRLI